MVQGDFPVDFYQFHTSVLLQLMLQTPKISLKSTNSKQPIPQKCKGLLKKKYYEKLCANKLEKFEKKMGKFLEI